MLGAELLSMTPPHGVLANCVVPEETYVVSIHWPEMYEADKRFCSVGVPALVHGVAASRL